MSIKILNIHDQIKKEKKFNFLNPSRSCIEVWKNYIKNNNLNVDINNLMCCIENCNNKATDGAHVFVSIDGNEQPGTYLAPTCHIPHNYSDIIQNKKYGETHKYNLTKFNKLEYFYLFPGSIEQDNEIKKMNQEKESNYQPNIVPDTVPNSIPDFVPNFIPNSVSDRHYTEQDRLSGEFIGICLIVLIILAVVALVVLLVIAFVIGVITLQIVALFVCAIPIILSRIVLFLIILLCIGFKKESLVVKKKVNLNLCFFIIINVISLFFFSCLINVLIFIIYYLMIGQTKKCILFIFHILNILFITVSVSILNFGADVIIIFVILFLCSFIYTATVALLASVVFSRGSAVTILLAILLTLFLIFFFIGNFIIIVIFIIFVPIIYIFFLLITFFDLYYLIRKGKKEEIKEFDFGGFVIEFIFFGGLNFLIKKYKEKKLENENENENELKK